MLQPFRDDFNARFSQERYGDLQHRIVAETRTDVEFRICETPCFFPRELLNRMATKGEELTFSLLDRADYMRASEASIPEQYRVANQSERPHFLTVDFGLVRLGDGSLDFRMVEMQAFPSVFGYQDVLSQQYVQSYGLAEDLERYLGGHTRESYWSILRDVIVGEHAPENVVLLEVTPEQQKTLPDFRVFEARLGIKTIDITAVRQRGNRLFYEDSGRTVPIERIFNRAIADEIERERIQLPFDMRADLDVEWAGHPNWYFHISKFSLPYLDDPVVPRSVFLDDWMEGKGRERLPEPRDRILLKPLYSFAGKGIQFAPTDADLLRIPKGDWHKYLIQERVDFSPEIRTPAGHTQAEIRIMYAWPDGGSLHPLISLVRLGRGMMMGVDHNRDQEWVGGSAALSPKG